MSTQDSTVLETNRAGTHFLRVCFERAGDRFAHRIVVCTDLEETKLLVSSEGDSDDRWPPSPPLQQMSCQDLPDGRQVVLLVGMAGRSHWSLSATTTADASALVFEAACRAVEPPQRLGSRYRILQTPQTGPGDALFWPGPPSCRLDVDALTTEPAAQIVVERDQIRIQRLPEQLAMPKTYRWSYHLALDPSNGLP